MTRNTKPLPNLLDLQQAASELTRTDRLWLRLHELLPDATPANEQQGSSKRKGKPPASPSPWNDEAGDLLTTIHGEARRYESGLTVLLFRHARYRGGDNANTLRCLELLPDLIVAALDRYPAPLDRDAQPTSEHQLAAAAARALVSWPRQARALFGEQRKGEEVWTRAPGYLQCPPLLPAPGHGPGLAGQPRAGRRVVQGLSGPVARRRAGGGRAHRPQVAADPVDRQPAGPRLGVTLPRTTGVWFTVSRERMPTCWVGREAGVSSR